MSNLAVEFTTVKDWKKHEERVGPSRAYHDEVIYRSHGGPAQEIDAIQHRGGEATLEAILAESETYERQECGAGCHWSFLNGEYVRENVIVDLARLVNAGLVWCLRRQTKRPENEVRFVARVQEAAISPLQWSVWVQQGAPYDAIRKLREMNGTDPSLNEIVSFCEDRPRAEYGADRCCNFNILGDYSRERIIIDLGRLIEAGMVWLAREMPRPDAVVQGHDCDPKQWCDTCYEGEK